MIKKITLLLLIALFHLNAVSQSENMLDSLKLELKKNLHDSVKCKLLALMVDYDFDDTAWPIHNANVIKICKKYINENAIIKNKQDSIFHVYLMNALSVEGFIEMNKGDFKSAMQYFDRIIKMEKNNSNPGVLSLVYNNIAGIHADEGNILSAKEYFEKCLKIGLDLDNDYMKAKAYGNIAMCLTNMSDSTIRFSYLTKALELYLKTNDKSGQAFIYNNLGRYYQERKKGKEEIEAYFKAYQINKEIGNNFGLCYLTSNISIYYERLHDKVNAFKYANESYALATIIKYPELIKTASYRLYELEKDNGNYKKSLEYYTQYHKMSDSIRSSDNLKASIKQKVQADFDKKEIIAQARHDQQLLLEQEKNEKQKLYTLFTAIGLLIVVLFSIFIYTRLQLINRQKKVIETQKTEVDLQHKVIEEKQKEIIDSITYAKRIQSAILPPDKLMKECLPNSFVLYKPKDIVAGDFYWLQKLDQTILFAAADCTGHGVPGALVSVVCNNGLNRSLKEYGLTNPAKILDKTRDLIIEEFEKSEEDVKDGMDISLCSLNFNTNELVWAGANNPIWIIRKDANDNFILEEIKADKQPIGKYAELNPFTSHQIKLNKGDTIYSFTDGFQDQFGGELGKKFKPSKLKELLLSCQSSSMEEQKLILNETFDSWKGTIEQIDDVCIIGVRV